MSSNAVKTELNKFMGLVVTINGPPNQVYEITNKELLNEPKPKIHWTNPDSTLTIRFMADPESKTPFRLRLHDIIYEEVYFERVLNGRHLPISREQNSIEFDSDNNNQVIIKCIADPNYQESRLGINVCYSIETD